MFCNIIGPCRVRLLCIQKCSVKLLGKSVFVFSLYCGVICHALNNTLPFNLGRHVYCNESNVFRMSKKMCYKSILRVT